MRVSINTARGVDLTQTIENGMTVYIGDAVPKVSSFKRLDKDGVNLSILTLGSHTGTHVDAPAHYVRDGTPLDRLPVEKLVGEAVTLDFSDLRPGSEITEADMQERAAKVASGDIVLVYTGLSKRWRDPRARRTITYLGQGAALWLVRRKVKAVGIDYLSVEKFKASAPVAHVALLSHGVPIIESLNSNLSRFIGRRMLFVCLPIKVKGCDGAPARAMAYPMDGGAQD